MAHLSSILDVMVKGIDQGDEVEEGSTAADCALDSQLQAGLGRQGEATGPVLAAQRDAQPEGPDEQFAFRAGSQMFSDLSAKIAWKLAVQVCREAAKDLQASRLRMARVRMEQGLAPGGAWVAGRAHDCPLAVERDAARSVTTPSPS